MKQPNLFKTSLKNFHLNKGGTLLIILLISGFAFSQNYTWMTGATVNDQGGVYGTMGVAAAANTPGSRDTPASWKDAGGNFWLFGGEGYDATGTFGSLNDLWKYNVTTNQWTWINGSNMSDPNGIYGTIGVASPLNMPGGRNGAGSWVDASGNLWMFGGTGIDASSVYGELNDLWKYNISTNQWTWIKGSNNALPTGIYGTQGTAANANTPGGRAFQSTWADGSGNLWLFGGAGYGNSTNNYGDLNDLWKYTISTNQWTWMKGSGINDQNGIYGTISISAASNNPGGRYLTGSWSDASGNLWLAGGAGYDISSANEDELNDLWRYNIANNQWTWIKGSNTSGQQGIYGTQGTAAMSNVPGGRFASISWADASGNFFLFGGAGYDGSNGMDLLNDLWKYNISTNQWTWVNGSSIAAQSGVYGTQGISAPTNMPGARGGCAGWMDASSNLWFFGGIGYDVSSTDPDDMNDLWRLSSCVNNPTVSIIATMTSFCAGNSATLTASGANTYSWSNNQTGSVNVVSPANTGVTTFTSYGSDLSGCTGSATVSINVLALPNLIATTDKNMICAGRETADLTAFGANNYSWTTVLPGSIISPSTSANVIVFPSITTTYTVTGTGSNGCSGTFSITQFVAACLGIEAGINSPLQYIMYPNPNNGAFMISGPGMAQGGRLVIFDALGRKVHEENLSADETKIQTQLQKGIYLYNIILNEQKLSSGKIMIE